VEDAEDVEDVYAAAIHNPLQLLVDVVCGLPNDALNDDRCIAPLLTVSSAIG